MKHSESIKEITIAMAKAQATLRAAEKDGLNPHFRSQYATLGSVWDACRDSLTKNGIVVYQANARSPEGNARTSTLLAHVSGEWISEELDLVPKDQSPQSYGSAFSYGRRYNLMAMVGIATADDDGNEATHSTPAPRPVQTRTAAEIRDQSTLAGLYTGSVSAELKPVQPKVTPKLSQNTNSPNLHTTAAEPGLKPAFSSPVFKPNNVDLLMEAASKNAWLKKFVASYSVEKFGHLPSELTDEQFATLLHTVETQTYSQANGALS